MQTSIEWLFEKLNVLDKHSDIPVRVSGTPQEWNNLFEQAKEMHKKEIIDAFENGEDNIDNDGCAINKNGAQSYYNENFKKD